MDSDLHGYPALVSHPAVPPQPQQPRPFIPPLPRRIRKVGAPLGVIIALGTVVGLIVILLTAVSPVGTAIGFVLASLATIVVLLAYLWLDRWEPEPPRLLILAFIWGASVAVVVSVIAGAVRRATCSAKPSRPPASAASRSAPR